MKAIARIKFLSEIYVKFVLRDCLKNPIRTWITILGIALGVSVFLAISLANQSALSSFEDTVDRISGSANLEVRPVAGRYLDQNILRDLQWLWLADAKYTPLIVDDVVLFDKNQNQVVRYLGVDVFADSQFKNYDTKSSGSGFGSPGGVLVGSQLAAEIGITEGQKIKLFVNDQMKEVLVTGILSDTGAGSVWGGRLLISDISVAQQLLSLEGQISQIAIIAPVDKRLGIQEKLNRELPPSMTAQPASTRGNQIEKMTRSFKYNLYALSMISLIVGMFLIYNTMAITVIRRRPEIGVLRTLGFSSKNVLSLLLLESLTFGGVGSFIGVLFGLGIANWALAMVAKTYQRLYFFQPLDGVNIEPFALVLAFLVGVVLTVLAALPAALEGAHVAPQEATRRMSLELSVDRSSSKFSILAFLLFVLSGFFAFMPPLFGFPVYGYLSAIFAVLGVAFALPFLLKLALPPLANLLSVILGFESRIAVTTLVRTLGRTSVAIATLAIGLSMLISLAIMIGSFRQTVIDWANQTLIADLWMRPIARESGSSHASFPAELETKLNKITGVEVVAPWTETKIEFNGMKVILGGAKFDVVEKHSNLLFLSNRPTSEVAKRVHGSNCIISESLALKNNLQQGDRLSIPTRLGEKELTVEDIYYDYVSDAGFIVIDRPTYVKFMQDDSIESFAIFVQKNYQPLQVRETIMRFLNREGNGSICFIRTTRQLKGRILNIFDDTFAITYALHTISIAVAILSVMNALFALTDESKREFGILKYLGTSDRSMKRIVYTQASVLGSLGSIFGTVLGLVLAFILVYVINKQSFGWTIRMLIPYEFIGQTFIVVFLTSLVSAVIPARIAARTPAPEVVKSE